MLAALLLSLPIALASAAQEQAPLRLKQDQVAVWNGGSISQDRFDRFLGANAHYQETGREALTHILQIQVVQIEADARGLKVDSKAVDARVQDAREQIELAGKSLEVLLSARQMGMKEFRSLMRDSLLHEQLVRADRNLPESAALTPEMLLEWTNARIAELLVLSASAPTGMMLDAPPFRVSEQEVGAIIRQTTGNEDLVDRVEQLVLMEALPQWAARQKIPLTDDILHREIEWRRKRVDENPAYGGTTYEDLLKVRNSTVEAVFKSEELRVAGYLRLLAAQRYPDSWFDGLSSKQRSAFDNEYGASRRVGWILMRAHEEKEGPLDLTFEEASDELLKLRDRIKSADDFRSIAADYSEDQITGRRQGMLGWVHRQEEGVTPQICAAAFEAPGKGIFGPVKITDPNPFAPVSGMALILVDGVREAPSEADFRALVRRGQHRQLRSQFLNEINLTSRWTRRFDKAH
ncbi:MAG: peptidylprolyl isomerase [Planctomycetota bacterium]